MSGLVNVWLAPDDDGLAVARELRALGLRVAGYRVEESIYTDYGDNAHAAPRDWPDGERSPGIVAVTLMERPKRLTREEWIRRWHGRQSPVSESMQPRGRYVRNVVERAVTDGAPPFEGIVEEAFPSPRHVTNLFLFFGADGLFRLVGNVTTMLRSVTSFLTLWRIRTRMMSEYFVRTDGPAARDDAAPAEGTDDGEG